jgi:hypothetical protein
MKQVASTFKNYWSAEPVLFSYEGRTISCVVDSKNPTRWKVVYDSSGQMKDLKEIYWASKSQVEGSPPCSTVGGFRQSQYLQRELEECDSIPCDRFLSAGLKAPFSPVEGAICKVPGACIKYSIP